LTLGSSSLRFGRVEVLPVQRQLRVDGIAMAVGARALDVLLALIEHRGRVLSKNELLDMAWPGLVVEEGNLKVQVSALRKLIGPQAIATIPARGYRFALPLDGDANVVMPSPAPAPLSASLPLAGNTLVGRDDDLATLQSLLQSHRLVTLLGPGGVGKTTLAWHAARLAQAHNVHSVCWVDLSAVNEPTQLPFAIAQALRLTLTGGRSSAWIDTVVAALNAWPLLLVLDNAEYVVAELAPLLQAALGGCPNLCVLVTSQAALKLPAEQVMRLAPLRMPSSHASTFEAMQCGALALFVQRAQAAQRGFVIDDGNLAAAVEVCRALDGLPLAIELAAARLPLLGLRGLLGRLDERLRLLNSGARGVPARQQSLRMALDWSHGLLDATEQTVFRRLGVFAGGFTLELAAAVACETGDDEWPVIDALGGLVERSLVAVDGCTDNGSTDNADIDKGVHQHNPAPRYRLLESARAYALAKLDAAGERGQVLQRHAQAVCSRARQDQRALWTEPEAWWLARCGAEIDNLRAALDHSTQHDPALAITLAGHSFTLFQSMALQHEIRQRCDMLEPFLSNPSTASVDRARFLLARGYQMRDRSVQLQHQCAQQAAALFRDSGDVFGLHEALYLVVRGFHAYPQDVAPAVREMQALQTADWPASRRAVGLIARSTLALVNHDMPGNRAALAAALPLAQQAGADRLTTVVLANLVDHELAVGHTDDAARRGQTLTTLLRRNRRDVQLAPALCNWANALLQQGQAVAARHALAEAMNVMRAQQWAWLAGFGDVYALLAAREQRFTAAALLLGWADEVRKSRGPRQVNELRCREQAAATINAAMSVEEAAAQRAQGSRLTVEQVASLTIAKGE
jgi:predicted ATPase/DNA-binding winged helix-turn-helix (wHTH) protein